MTLPLISCLCVSRGNLDLAISCFEQQTYPNREMVVVQGVADWPERELPEGVRLIRGKFPYVGDMRNAGIQAAAGEYIVTWDDDDWSAPERMQKQFEKLGSSHATVLGVIGLYDAEKHEAYRSAARLWEGTLMLARKKHLAIPYVSELRGGDTKLVAKLTDSGGCGINRVDDLGLFIYNYHGGNLWDRNHFNSFFQQAMKLPKSSADEFLLRLRQGSNAEPASGE